MITLDNSPPVLINTDLKKVAIANIRMCMCAYVIHHKQHHTIRWWQSTLILRRQPFSLYMCVLLCDSSQTVLLSNTYLSTSTFENWRAKQPSQVDVSWTIWSVEELETLPVGTKPRTSHHRSPGWEKPGKSKRQMIFLGKTRDPGGPSPIRQALELFQRQHWGNFFKRIRTVLNCTEHILAWLFSGELPGGDLS